MIKKLYLGIDVGTGSARAGLFTAEGRQVGAASYPIKMWKPRPDFVEQSSEDIWQACARSVKAALKQAGATGAEVRGIGFDATCSLVALDGAGKPLSISPSGRDEQNVIVWMDHRAIAQAERINRTSMVSASLICFGINIEARTGVMVKVAINAPASA